MVEHGPEFADGILISEGEIKQRVKELGQEITRDYKNEDSLLMVCVLKGAIYFTADLSREVQHPNLEIETMVIKSYGSNTESSREPIIHLDILSPIKGKNVLIVEDIVDTGYSLKSLLDRINARNPKSLKICAFLAKDETREIDVPVAYRGFNTPNGWLFGYGLDNNELDRNKKDIWIRKKIS